MSYLGDFFSGCTVAGSFTTVTTTGAPTVLTGTAGSVCIVAYKLLPADATGLTCSTAGITLATNCLGVTGLNTFAVNTNSDLTFYSCGREFVLILQGGTVGGTCVSGYTVAQFSLDHRSGLRPTVHGRTLDVSSGGEAGVDWANVGSPTTAVGLSCTTLFSITSVTNSVRVASNVKKNIDLDCFSFLMTDSTNHNPMTTASVAATRSLDGASFASTVTQPSHLANGIYLIDLDKSDLNACVVTMRFTATGADDLFITLVTDVP